MTKTIICLAGGSGVGKTYAANMLKQLFTNYGHDCKVVCSCTTRAKRPGEVDDIDHQFKNIVDYKAAQQSGDILADTVYGGETYWTTFSQLSPGINLYVIDEIGIQALYRTCKDRNIQIVTVKVTADADVIAKRNIAPERLARDPKLVLRYDLVCKNNQPADVVRMYSKLKQRLHIQDANLYFSINQLQLVDVNNRNITITLHDDLTHTDQTTRTMNRRELIDLFATIGKYLFNS